MTHQIYNNRRVIWESKKKQVWTIIGSFVFVGAAFWTNSIHTNPFMFWITILFFGAGGLLLLVRLINPKNVFVTPNTSLGKQITTDEFQTLYDNFGFFSYTDTTFTLAFSKETKIYNWTDIECLFGFKKDLYTTDEICLDVFLTDGINFRISESTGGWFQFLKQLSQHIPTIPKNWDIEISTPAFETMLTLLYDKKDRTKEQAQTDYYKD